MKSQQTKTKPKTKPKEKKVEQPEPRTRSEMLVKEWLLKRDFKTKLAVTILAGYMQGDHGAYHVYHDITKQFGADVISVAEKPGKSIGREELVMLGVAAELEVWSEYL